MGGKAFDVIAAIVWVALIFVLVRPGSQGPTFVTAVGDSLKNLLSAATGGGTWSGK
jgi:hypothetical protein